MSTSHFCQYLKGRNIARGRDDVLASGGERQAKSDNTKTKKKIIDLTFRRKGQETSWPVVGAYQLGENGEYLPIFLDSIAEKANFPVVLCVAKRYSKARARALEFIKENPTFKGAVLYSDDGTYSFEPTGQLLLVNRPDIGKVNEEELLRIQEKKKEEAKMLQKGEELKQRYKVATESFRGRWLVNLAFDENKALSADFLSRVHKASVQKDKRFFDELSPEEVTRLEYLAGLNQRLGNAHKKLYVASYEDLAARQDLLNEYHRLKQEILTLLD